jgi:hypothetical protein
MQSKQSAATDAVDVTGKRLEGEVHVKTRRRVIAKSGSGEYERLAALSTLTNNPLNPTSRHGLYASQDC